MCEFESECESVCVFVCACVLIIGWVLRIAINDVISLTFRSYFVDVFIMSENQFVHNYSKNNIYIIQIFKYDTTCKKYII